MPETPDFDQIARTIVKAHDNADGEGMDGNPGFLPIDHEGQLTIDIAEQLRLIWNARGAADLAIIDVLYEMVTPTMKTLDRTVRTLDR
jgi:hypothetical protein